MSRQFSIRFLNSLRRATGLISIVAGLAIFSGCDPGTHFGPYQGDYPYRVVCTTGMVADMARRIGGQWISVDQLMGEGVDPHVFKSNPDIVAKLNNAHVNFYSGLHLEANLAEILESMGKRRPTVAITSTVPHDKLITAEGEALDPHIWFDVSLWSETAEAVRAALVKFDPAHEADYNANAAAYRAELAALHTECKTRLQEIPKESRVLVTAHDAFHYFGRAYDVEVKAIQGVSTEAEAGLKETNELEDFIVQRKIKAVFVEESVNEKSMTALIAGCKKRGHDVKIGGKLYSDSMGAPGTVEGTYAGMVRRNVEVIVGALK